MKKQITVLRTAPYTYRLPNMNLYQSFDAVAQRRIDVPLKNTAKAYFFETIHNILYDQVLCSPTIRSVQTAQFLVRKPEVIDTLYEVLYSMHDFIDEKDFYLDNDVPDVQKARIAFVNALIKNTLQESYEEVIYRVEKIIQIIKKSSSSRIILFSHGFFMKILESYIKDKRIKEYSERLLLYFDGEKETFTFCEGFTFLIDDDIIAFNNYIRRNI